MERRQEILFRCKSEQHAGDNEFVKDFPATGGVSSTDCPDCGEEAQRVWEAPTFAFVWTGGGDRKLRD